MSKSVKLIREQKEEYMDHLFDLVYEPVHSQYQKIYKDVCQSKEGLVKGILKTFQKEVANIPDWNQLKVDEFYQNFLEKTKCLYFVELLKTIYILSVKLVLLGLPQEHRNKIQIKVPAPETFLHRLLIHVARDVWKRPYLFYHQVKSVEQQNHLYQFEMIVRRKIRSVIRDTLPIDLMVQHMSSSELLKMQGNEEESSSEDEESTSEDEESTSEDEESASEDEEPSSEDEESSSEDEESASKHDEELINNDESVKEEKSTDIIQQEIAEPEPINNITEITPEPEPIQTIVSTEIVPVIESSPPKELSIIDPEPETIYEDTPIVRKSLEVESSDESVPIIREEQPPPSHKKLIHIQELIRHKKKSHSRPKNAFF